MKRLVWLAAIFLICSDDGGLTRFVFEAVGPVFFAEGGIHFQEKNGTIYHAGPTVECVLKDSDTPPPVEGLIQPEHPEAK
jgi:hypothetical protein